MDKRRMKGQFGFGESLKTMKPVTRDLSVIVGCYNESANLETNIIELAQFLDGLKRSYELLVVDDGSLDNSVAILRDLEQKVPGLVVLRNPKNMGKGFSIRNGILNCSGKYIIFTDSDMAYAQTNVRTVLERLESGCPVVVGNRRLPDSVYTVNNRLVRYVYRRHFLGTAFNLVIRRLFGITTHDTQSGLKGFQRQVAERIFERIYTDGFLFDVEVFVRAKRLGIPIEEIPVHLTYSSDASTVRQLRSFFTILPELMRIKMLDLRGAYDSPPLPQADHADGTPAAHEQRSLESNAAAGSKPPANP
ncbi:MAG TPA: glycosyltransferase [Nitrospiria bacterium]|nr:glycosyltransferase [Nitrospiria bacterium]